MEITYTFENGLYLNITNKCQNRCEFCVRQNRNSVGDASTLWLEREPTLNEVVNSVFSRNLADYNEVVFCGYGEPTCRMDVLTDIARKIRAVNPSIPIRVNTNGLGSIYNKRDIAPEFSGLVDTISISLNASTAEKYNEICKPAYGEAAFDGMLDFTKKVTRYVPSVIMSVVDIIGEKEIDACRKICEQCGAVYKVRTYIPKEN